MVASRVPLCNDYHMTEAQEQALMEAYKEVKEEAEALTAEAASLEQMLKRRGLLDAAPVKDTGPQESPAKAKKLSTAKITRQLVPEIKESVWDYSHVQTLIDEHYPEQGKVGGAIRTALWEMESKEDLLEKVDSEVAANSYRIKDLDRLKASNKVRKICPISEGKIAA